MTLKEAVKSANEIAIQLSQRPEGYPGDEWIQLSAEWDCEFWTPEPDEPQANTSFGGTFTIYPVNELTGETDCDEPAYTLM